MTWYIKHPKKSTKKSLELINKFSKVEEHMINRKKSAVFLYSNSVQSKQEINNSIHKVSKRIKYFGINLTKKVKDLYTKNYITLRKNLQETFITSKFVDGKTVLRFSRKTEPTGRACACVKKSCIHSFQYMWIKKFIITNWLLGFWKLRSSKIYTGWRTSQWGYFNLSWKPENQESLWHNF